MRAFIYSILLLTIAYAQAEEVDQNSDLWDGIKKMLPHKSHFSALLPKENKEKSDRLSLNESIKQELSNYIPEEYAESISENISQDAPTLIDLSEQYVNLNKETQEIKNNLEISPENLDLLDSDIKEKAESIMRMIDDYTFH